MKIKKLSNGLHIITAPVKGTNTVTFLVLIATGSRYEPKPLNGISHVLEHMFFKGTENRPEPGEIARELDQLGAEFNAFTGKEYTGYYVKVASTFAKAALDVLSDMMLHPIFSADELKKEKNVVIQEIKMYEDTPLRHVNDLFESLLYGDHPMGREIAGSPKTVLGVSRETLVSYFKKHYGGKNTYVIAAGNIPTGIDALLTKTYSVLAPGAKDSRLALHEKQQRPGFLYHVKDTDQTHVIVGVRTVKYTHADRPVLELMRVILGGSMSSRLFTEVREKRGLAYNVRTNVDHFTDAGYLATQVGVPHDKVVAALETILREYQRLITEPVSPAELRKAKGFFEGQLKIDLEASDQMANYIGGQAVLTGKVAAVEGELARVLKVSSQDIQRVAKKIFINEGLNVALIGPKRTTAEIKKVVTF